MAIYLRIRQFDVLTSNIVATVSNITVNGNQAGTVLGLSGSGQYTYELQVSADAGEDVTVAATRLVAFSTLR